MVRQFMVMSVLLAEHLNRRGGADMENRMIYIEPEMIIAVLPTQDVVCASFPVYDEEGEAPEDLDF